MLFVGLTVLIVIAALLFEGRRPRRDPRREPYNLIRKVSRPDF
jgi:uncharacterized membrane protein affecting hemolysin expression